DRERDGSAARAFDAEPRALDERRGAEHGEQHDERRADGEQQPIVEPAALASERARGRNEACRWKRLLARLSSPKQMRDQRRRRERRDAERERDQEAHRCRRSPSRARDSASSTRRTASTGSPCVPARTSFPPRATTEDSQARVSASSASRYAPCAAAASVSTRVSPSSAASAIGPWNGKVSSTGSSTWTTITERPLAERPATSSGAPSGRSKRSLRTMTAVPRRA